MALGVRTVAANALVFAGTIVLARMLDPQEFGVFAVLQFALTFFQLFGDAGLGGALIQRQEPPSELALATVFTFQSILAVAITAILWLAAPALPLVWHGLPADAPWLLRAMSLGFLLTTARVIPSLLLERELRFGVVAVAEIAQVVAFYAAAIACATGGLRAWTWPAAVIAQAVTGAGILCAARPWRPRFALDRASLGQLLRFGVPFQLKNLVGFANGAVTPLYAGAALGPGAVGLIGWGQQLAYLPLKVVEIVARVAFPLFSRMQYDRDRLARVLERALQLCASGVFFTTALFVAAGPTITVVVYSEKWLGGLLPLYAFSTVLLVGFVSPVVGAVLDALGRPGIIARLALGWTALNWVVVPLATWRWGFQGFVLGYCVHVVVGNFALLTVLPSVVPGARLLRPLLAPAAGGTVVAALAWWVLRPWATTVPRLGLGVAALLAVHLAVFVAFDRDALKSLRTFLGSAEPP